MADQTDNVLLEDETLGLPRTIDVGNDAIVLSTDMTLQAGGVIVADNFKRGTTDPNGSVAGNEGDVFQRITASTGDLYVNSDGTTTGWELQLGPANHLAVDQLVHNIAETSFFQVSRSGGFVTTVTYWTDSGMSTKVRETTLSRTGSQVSGIVDVQYDSTGSAVQTLTGTVTRSSGQIVSIDWVLT